MTLTDGKPSFLFQTNEKVLQLKDKHTKLFFVPVTEFKGKELKLMKKWASAPWPTNLVHIPGLNALGADGAVFAQKCLVMFCPESISPSNTKVKEKTAGFMLVRENGLCGKRGKLLSRRRVTGAAECAALASGSGSEAFLLGTWFRRGYCYSSPLEVDTAMYEAWEANRVNPTCSAGDGWTNSRIFDFYAIAPMGH